LVLAAVMVALSATWRAGVRRVAIMLVVVGAISILLTLLAGYGMNRASQYAKGPLEQSALKVGNELGGSLRIWWMGYGVALAVAGAGALTALRFVKPQQSES